MFRFLSRVAFLCNIVFLLVMGMHFMPNLQNWDSGLVSNLVITGYWIAVPLTIIANFCWLLLYLQNKEIEVPFWLRIANLVFLILQILYFQFT